VSKRIRAGEDPYPITFCRQITTTAYEEDKNLGMKNALLDLLNQILFSPKLSEKEKKKKLKKFKESYPNIYLARFPNVVDEPEYMQQVAAGAAKKNMSALGRFSSLSRLKSVIRI
jgi:hypothetical protein